MHRCQREGSLDPRKNACGSLLRVHALFKRLQKQVCQNLGIGLAGKFMSSAFKRCTKGNMVFNDAIMDNGNLFACHMRVRVLFGHTAMRGPARVADAGLAGKRGLTHQIRQVLQLADRARQ